MKRILFGLLLIWAAVATVVIVLLLVQGSDDESGASAGDAKTFSCQALQRRAERCEAQLVRLAGETAEDMALRRGGSQVGAASRRMVVEGVVQSAIRDGKVLSYCQRYDQSEKPMIQRFRQGVVRCYGTRGCQVFASCLRKLVQTEGLIF